MALQLTYNGMENCYLKAVPTTINEFYIDELKTFSTYIIYSISYQNEIFFRDGFEMNFNPDEPIFEQIYNKVKTIYLETTDI